MSRYHTGSEAPSRVSESETPQKHAPRAADDLDGGQEGLEAPGHDGLAHAVLAGDDHALVLLGLLGVG